MKKFLQYVSSVRLQNSQGPVLKMGRMKKEEKQKKRYEDDESSSQDDDSEYDVTEYPDKEDDDDEDDDDEEEDDDDDEEEEDEYEEDDDDDDDENFEDDEENKETKEVQKVFKTLTSMASARGYLNIEKPRMVDGVGYIKCSGGLLMILKVGKFRISDARLINISEITDLVIVVTVSVTPSAQKYLNSMWGHRMQTFSSNQLYRNFIEHSIVPKHSVVRGNDLVSLKAKYRLNSVDQLPKIKVTDAIVRYYAWLPGDVIKIERVDGNYYRVVIV
jgi:DNA-directed RNA polymerase subunit H (RpoH/RPB5)